jgi:hypothetical protein
MTTENVAKIYLLITTLNAALYAIAELEPSKMTQTNKFRINNLRDAISNKKIMSYKLMSKVPNDNMQNDLSPLIMT